MNGDDSCNWERIREQIRDTTLSRRQHLKDKEHLQEFRGLRGLVIKMLDSILWRIVPKEIESTQDKGTLTYTINNSLIFTLTLWDTAALMSTS